MIQWFNKKLKNRKGFTLIELIVVIAILGILALIAIPRLIGFTQRAEESAELANARTLYNAYTIALADNQITISAGTFTSLSSDMETYLDEWPTDREDRPMQVVVAAVTGGDGFTVRVNDGGGAYLAGASN